MADSAELLEQRRHYQNNIRRFIDFFPALASDYLDYRIFSNTETGLSQTFSLADSFYLFNFPLKNRGNSLISFNFARFIGLSFISS